MIIIFYNADSDKFHICSPTEKTQIISKNDPDLISYIQNDDILYVTNGHYFTKQQFLDCISGKMTVESKQNNLIDASSKHVFNDKQVSNKQDASSNRYYIHPKHAGTVLIEDIHTRQYPEGIAMHGKWHFIDISTIGGIQVLENSAFYRVLNKKGKVEIVDEQYVQQNKHKINISVSPSEQALNKILVRDGTPGTADKVADAGGISNIDNDVAIPVFVTGE